MAKVLESKARKMQPSSSARKRFTIESLHLKIAKKKSQLAQDRGRRSERFGDQTGQYGNMSHPGTSVVAGSRCPCFERICLFWSFACVV